VLEVTPLLNNLIKKNKMGDQTKNSAAETPEEKQNNHSNGNNFVSIKIKDDNYEIHRGSQSVKAIKLLGGVPIGYTLVLLDGDDVKPLPNDGKVTIKGGEVFDCVPPNGSNS